MHVFFKPHAVRVSLYSNKGLVAWKTSRSEGYFRRTRLTRLVVAEVAEKMGEHVKYLGIKNIDSIVFKGRLRKTFSRSVLFSFIKSSFITKINSVITDSCIRFGGCKLPKKSR